jgi:uncharacterized protein (DUF2336 family)
VVNEFLSLGWQRAAIHRCQTGPALSENQRTALDTSVFIEVIDHGTPAARLALASQLATHFADAETVELERKQLIPVILKLAVDPVSAVREALASGLATVNNLDADIVFSIISDEDDIALPFLARTSSLNHWHMLAILKVGDEARQAVIALRSDISADAIAHIIDHSPMETCLALFDNPSVSFSDAQYHALFARFGQAAAMSERLLSRADLPLDIRIMQAKRASNRMHQLMAERGWVPANDAADLVADAEENAILRILIEASEGELGRVVPFLLSRGMLTPSIIVRAACLGELHVVEMALVHLAGVSATRVRDAMAGRGLWSFKSLHGKSGLPASCLGILQAACDVARDEMEEGVALDSESFGRRLIEALMTRYPMIPLKERAKHLEFIGRFAEDRVRIIARRLKADIVRAA